MSQQKIKGVIFDLDNTLLDFMKMKELAVKAAIRSMIEAGLLVDEELSYNEIISIYEQFGWENQKVFDVFIEKQIGRVDNKFLAAGIVAYRRAREANLMAYPNVNKTLMSLAKMGIKLGVVSDAPSREAWMRICYVNLHHIFDEVVTFDDTKKRKPAPEPFERIIALLDVPAENILMVGDWPERDVFGAKEVGMKTAFAKYGDSFGVVESGADYDLDDLSQLIEIIQNENEK